MNRIQILDEATSNRIAAGEVVERPASVIKELCENSLDAGATAISVDIEAGGMKYIGISDNGSGIYPEDVKSAFLRHATGKIRSGDSLSAIETLGFRGEALSSIAAVSKLRMTTRMQSAEMGREIEIHGGKVLYEEDCGCPEGTSFEIRDLFYNTPARLKFIKSPAPEAAACSDTIARMILANPDISIRFTNNGKLVYHSPGSGLADAIHAVYGQDISANLIPVAFEQHGVELSGYIGAPEISRKNRVGQTIIINGRYVRSAAISEAVKEGYGQKLMIGRFPFFVLHANLSPATVDVNVHPQKLEIKLSNEEALCNCIEQAVQNALGQRSDVREFTLPVADETVEQVGMEPIEPIGFIQANPANDSPEIEESISAMREELGSLYHTAPEQQGMSDTGGLLAEEKIKPNVQAPAENTNAIAPGANAFGQTPRLIGQAFETYAIVQSDETLYLIDQHAAHERLTYDRYMEQANANAIASQQLLSPSIIRLTYAEMQVYQENRVYFEQLGFETESFGSKEIAIRAVPLVLGEAALESLFKDALDSIAEHKAASAPELIKARIITSACKHSIKAGDAMSVNELNDLIQKLGQNESLTCPHGRPVAVRIEKKDLEKGFKRLV